MESCNFNSGKKRELWNDRKNFALESGNNIWIGKDTLILGKSKEIRFCFSLISFLKKSDKIKTGFRTMFSKIWLLKI